ncbi:MAG: carboxypeptidase-like regulatory domain-containing protein [Dysgonomonas sp.]
MNIDNRIIKTGLFVIILSIFCLDALAQVTSIQGTVRDSITGKPISYATIRFDQSTSGGLSDEEGHFKISNNSNKNVVICTLMGYNTKSITIPKGRLTTMDILLSPEGVNLSEVVIRPTKEKYSKKNNPAVELIKKVIARKNNYTIANQDYYKSQEYDRIFFAFNEFDSTHTFF